MFEVITKYTVENEIDIMGLRSELSYIIRSKHGDDTHIISSRISGEKTYITLIYGNVDKNGQYLQDYADGYIVNDNGILVLDHLEFDSLCYNRHWLYDAINLLGGIEGKYYVSVDVISKDEGEYQDPDYLVSYDNHRTDMLNKIRGLWDGMWMKHIGLFVNTGWPIVRGEHENWFKVTEHIPRLMGNFYEFYSRRLRGHNDITFRIPYNFSIIHEICASLPNNNIEINGGFITIHDGIDTYEDINNISNVIERAILVKYKTADYWGDIDDIIKPWSIEFNVQSIKINGYQCHLAKIPNVVSVEDGRKMIAYMLQDQVKVK